MSRSKIEQNALITLFERMESENWAYRWGGAKEGCVDCSGAFVYAYRELGGLKLEHSSNYMARRSVGTLRPIEEAQPGWAVFKWRRQSDKTPKRWQDGRGDYYHVGLMGRDGCVLHASGSKSGFIKSSAKGWTYAAPLLAVQYEEEADVKEKVLYRAEVVTKEDPLRIRRTPVTGDVIGHAPIGATVDVLEDGEWAKIRYQGIVGYASRAFLQAELGKDDLPESVDVTTLIEASTGQVIRLVGRWREAKD